jgi:hypothetical protein
MPRRLSNRPIIVPINDPLDAFAHWRPSIVELDRFWQKPYQLANAVAKWAFME